VAKADNLVEAVEQASSWDERVALVRKVPEDFGISQHQTEYAEIARFLFTSEPPTDGDPMGRGG
jgi:hypothetical protein